MDTARVSARSNGWRSWFLLHAATHAVPQYVGGDGSIRLAVNPDGTGILVEGEGRLRTLSTPTGRVLSPLLSPSGAVAWFHDHDGTEAGQWLSQSLQGGSIAPLDTDLPRGYFAGAAAGPQSIAIGIGTDEGVRVYASTPSGDGLRQIEGAGSEARVRAVSWDGQMVAVSAADPAAGAVRIARVVNMQEAVGSFTDLVSDVEPVGFLPTDGGNTLVLRHSRPTGEGLLLWDIENGREQEVPNTLPGDITDVWVTADAIVLARCHAEMRARLYHVNLTDGRSRLLSPRHGSVGRTIHHSGETTTFTWSSLKTPSTQLAADQAAPTPRITEEVQDIRVPSDTGSIPALIIRPQGPVNRRRTVFLVHGGPGLTASDAFDPRIATYLQAGFVVVQINYRGSAGHGAAWRNAHYANGPIAQANDLAAVRTWCVDQAITDPTNCLLHGTSWGGYLALLAAGLHPRLWTGVVAVSPIADLLHAYDEAPQPQRDLFTDVFGGSPTHAVERYQAASPRTYTAQLEVPILIVAYAMDARSPLEQIRRYVADATSLEKQVELNVFPGGHRGHTPTSRIQQMDLFLQFARAETAPGVVTDRRRSDAVRPNANP